MNKNKSTETKVLPILFAVTAIVLLFCACGKPQETAKKPESETNTETKTETEAKPMTGLANPLHECTRDELVQATGIPLDAPDGASEVKYFYIDSEDTPISQVTFSLNGKQYCYRAQPTAYVRIEANVDENADEKDLMSALNDCTNIGAALSGMHYKWECASLNDIAESRDAVVAFNDGKEGFVAWLDVVPGILYSLSMNNGASQTVLTDTAELCFVPVQNG